VKNDQEVCWVRTEAEENFFGTFDDTVRFLNKQHGMDPFQAQKWLQGLLSAHSAFVEERIRAGIWPGWQNPTTPKGVSE
jgi:hypothetical protein